MPTISFRYIVDDVDAALAFYRDQLGFTEVMHPAPAFAMLQLGDLRLLLSAPNPDGGGGQTLTDGGTPQPGGWNRFTLEVSDLPAEKARLEAAGVRLRSDLIAGIGGDQLLVEDPSGNLIELFAPTRDDARLEG
ncbi:MAG: VOC family protein [Nocardioides sp.]